MTRKHRVSQKAKQTVASIRKEAIRAERAVEKLKRQMKADEEARAALANRVVERLRDVLRPADDDHPLIKSAMTVWMDFIVPSMELMIRAILTPLIHESDPQQESLANVRIDDVRKRIVRAEQKSQELDDDIRAGKMVRRVDAVAAIETVTIEFVRRLKKGLKKLRASTIDERAFAEESQAVLIDAMSVLTERLPILLARRATKLSLSQRSRPSTRQSVRRDS